MTLFTPKRDGLLALFLMAIALSGVLGYFLWWPWQETRPTLAKPLPALPDIQVPDDAVLNEMTALRKHLNRLAYPRAAASREVALGLFGYTPATPALRREAGSTAGLTPPPAQFDYVLSFALAAGRRHLCLLDGQLFAQGAELPDGGRILAIEPDRVLIEKAPLQRWIYLQEPELGREAPAEARGPVPSSHEEL